MVYRGPAALPVTVEAVVNALSTSFNVVYAGPGEKLNIEIGLNSKLTVYVQPGGSEDMIAAWNDVKPFKQTILNYVKTVDTMWVFAWEAILPVNKSLKKIPQVI